MRRMLAVLALVAAGLSGCAGAQKHLATKPEVTEYRIGSEDVIEVAVYQSENLSRTLPVRPDGKVSLPLLGDVVVAGKTANEVGTELQSRYGKYVSEPRVAVIVREVNAPRVYVLGEVGHPGSFPLRGEMNVVQAVALAGGFGPFASRSSLVLIRRGAKGEERNELDYDDMIDDGEIPCLMPGDTLVVP